MDEMRSLEKKMCLSGSGLTKIFGFGNQKTLAVDHVDFNWANRAAERPLWQRCCLD